MEQPEPHVEEDKDNDDEKGGYENAGDEAEVGFRPICRLAWSGSNLAVARFTKLQIYSKGAALGAAGAGPLTPSESASGALINTLQWSEGISR